MRTFGSFGEIRILMDDLFRVRPTLYWTDLSVTMIVAWGAFYAAVRTPWAPGPAKVGWMLLSAFAFFRGLVFIHELAHVPHNKLFGFRAVWNALCGMMFFLPDYTYAPHAKHHHKATFSTKEDPEYVPVAYQHVWEILAPFLIFPFVPLILAIRFLVAGPISLIVGGRFREWLLRHASTLKMNPAFEWNNISPAERRQSVYQDLLCLGWWIAFIAFCGRWGRREVLIDWYLITWFMFVINHIRSLARHRYINASGMKVGYEDQLLDSLTVTGFSPLTWLFMPVGLRYHSMHHMFSTLPYHALGPAHRRLLENLPADHLYRKTLVSSFSAALVNLFKTVLTVARSTPLREI
jgi:fatty acid desaturase